MGMHGVVPRLADPVRKLQMTLPSPSPLRTESLANHSSLALDGTKSVSTRIFVSERL